MTNKNNDLSQSPEWLALLQHHHELAGTHMRKLFADHPERQSAFRLRAGSLSLDYSRNCLTEKTINLLCQLADRAQLQQRIDDLFSGKPVNVSENRAVLHTALRDHNLNRSTDVISEQIKHSREQTANFVKQIHSGAWLGATGKPIQHIVNIGIGGSHLGPKMTTEALKDFAIAPLKFHFLSSIDHSQTKDIVDAIDPATTLFIVSSKTFGTLETISNAKAMLDWMTTLFGKSAIAKHFVAVTAANAKAMEFGIPAANIFPIWDWVGGRYSIWSAIGLPLQLMLGEKQFNEFLQGAHDIDEHFRHTPFKQNLPVLMGLLTVWYVNFFHASACAVAPYSHRLRHLISYLQQADMESNGKCINLDGKPVNYATGPVIFGEEGCNGQHSYHQLLHQGKHLIPIDIIIINKPNDPADKQHKVLCASGISQANALMLGRTLDESRQELLQLGYNAEEIKRLASHRIIPGNRPNNLLQLDELNPRSLGALIALYEHKIYVAGVIWHINSFDQWGVELGKQLLPDILEGMDS